MEDKMLGKKILVLLVTLLCGCAGGGEKSRCQTAETCLNDPHCQCWCSQKCGFRKKEASDNPVYINDDSNGKFCYCKQWDIDNYENNCKLNKRVKEPKDTE
jgi:hypothetical protein